MERSAERPSKKGEHAAAPDLMRWAEAKEPPCSRPDPTVVALYLKVLRHREARRRR